MTKKDMLFLMNLFFLGTSSFTFLLSAEEKNSTKEPFLEKKPDNNKKFQQMNDDNEMVPMKPFHSVDNFHKNETLQIKKKKNKNINLDKRTEDNNLFEENNEDRITHLTSSRGTETKLFEDRFGGKRILRSDTWLPGTTDYQKNFREWLEKENSAYISEAVQHPEDLKEDLDLLCQLEIRVRQTADDIYKISERQPKLDSLENLETLSILLKAAYEGNNARLKEVLGNDTNKWLEILDLKIAKANTLATGLKENESEYKKLLQKKEEQDSTIPVTEQNTTSGSKFILPLFKDIPGLLNENRSIIGLLSHTAESLQVYQESHDRFLSNNTENNKRSKGTIEPLVQRTGLTGKDFLPVLVFVQKNLQQNKKELLIYILNSPDIKNNPIFDLHNGERRLYSSSISAGANYSTQVDNWSIVPDLGRMNHLVRFIGDHLFKQTELFLEQCKEEENMFDKITFVGTEFAGATAQYCALKTKQKFPSSFIRVLTYDPGRFATKEVALIYDKLLGAQTITLAPKALKDKRVVSIFKSLRKLKKIAGSYYHPWLGIVVPIHRADNPYFSGTSFLPYQFTNVDYRDVEFFKDRIAQSLANFKKFFQ